MVKKKPSKKEKSEVTTFCVSCDFFYLVSSYGFDARIVYRFRNPVFTIRRSTNNDTGFVTDTV